MQKKDGFLHVRLDSDLKEYVAKIKERPGGISRFINDALRADREKTEKGAR